MIFCDMDGVLVDFDAEFERNHGILPYKLPRQELWQIVLDTKDYWVNLPKQKDADELMSYLNKYDFRILTGLPAYGFDKAEKEKKQWLKNQYGIENGVICCLSKDKQNYGAPKDILIDDRENNIKNWEAMGGIGILHTSAQETIKQLQKLIDKK
jgi:5'(3')-deoxyribonucleotidase